MPQSRHPQWADVIGVFLISLHFTDDQTQFIGVLTVFGDDRRVLSICSLAPFDVGLIAVASDDLQYGNLIGVGPTDDSRSLLKRWLLLFPPGPSQQLTRL